MIVNLKFAGQVEACMFVELDIALHLKQADSHLPGLLQGMVQQLQAISFALIVRVDADGAECP